MKGMLTIIGITLSLLFIGYLITQYKKIQDVHPTTYHLPNPASQNCIDKGGSLKIMERGDGGQYGLCQFEDNRACEEWALYRQDCPVGGVKTTGYDDIEQEYCAWLGGQTTAVENPTCLLPDGTSCTADALYNGNCVPQQVSDPTPEQSIQ